MTKQQQIIKKFPEISIPAGMYAKYVNILSHMSYLFTTSLIDQLCIIRKYKFTHRSTGNDLNITQSYDIKGGRHSYVWKVCSLHGPTSTVTQDFYSFLVHLMSRGRISPLW